MKSCCEFFSNTLETPTSHYLWEIPNSHRKLEVFLGRLEKELFWDDISKSTQGNSSAEEWKALRDLAPDKTIAINGAGKVPQW